jgi:hypothetical protein
MPGLAADKKKKPTATPSTLPPTSPMLAVPPPDASAENQDGKLISSELSGRDLDFFTKATETGRRQAYFVGLLKIRGSTAQIKSLADSFNQTQEEENTLLAALATRKGLTISLDPTAALVMEGTELNKLTGADFDNAVLAKVAEAGQQSGGIFQDAVSSTDPGIKKFAAQMLPIAEQKRHILEKMAGKGTKLVPAFRSDSATPPPATPVATPTPKGKSHRTPAPKTTPPAKSTPPASPTPAPATPGPTPSSTPAATATPAGPATPKGKAVPTPTPTPAASTVPIATPPGLFTPHAALPAIVPSKSAIPVALPTPVQPPTATPPR